MTTEPPESATGPTEVLLSDLCPYCNANPPKYRCPACDARSCSLPCSRRHKIFNQCTGVRDPTKYVRRSDLQTATALDRDYNYLTGIERLLDRPPVLTTSDGRNDDDDNDDDEDEDGGARGGFKVDEETRRRRLAEALENKGVQVRLAPAGMKRARENKTIIAGKKRKKSVRWTVEWILHDGTEDKRFLTERLPEHQPLSEAYGDLLLTHLIVSEKSQRRRVVDAAKYYLKKVDVPANAPTLIALRPDKGLSDILKGHVVLEYPTIYVCSEPPKDMAVVEPGDVRGDVRGAADKVSDPVGDAQEQTERHGAL